MENRLLIVYGTRYGSTREVAEYMANVFRQQGTPVDLTRPHTVDSLLPYSGVVIGSPIRGGKPLPEIERFVETHHVALGSLPVAYFALCRTMRVDTAANRINAHHFLDPLRARVPAADIALLAGRIDPFQYSPMMRWYLHLTARPIGDWRDWKLIEAVSHRFCERLAA